jgi:hypothetical protein
MKQQLQIWWEDGNFEEAKFVFNVMGSEVLCENTVEVSSGNEEINKYKRHYIREKKGRGRS